MNISSLNKKNPDVPIIEIQEDWIRLSKVRLFLKREDLIHPEMSGNKWRKLKYNLIEAKNRNASSLLTFGGAFSNHIYATASAGKAFGFKTIGIIRGEEVEPLSPTLQYARASGMQLIFINRTAYRNKQEVLARLPFDFSTIYVLPEGGTNNLALKGCTEIISRTEVTKDVDFWAVSCGTGGTLAGMATALENHQKVIGFSSLKGDFLKHEVKQLLENYSIKKTINWSINTDYHFGGYVKFDQDLIDFINDFKQKHQIQLDPIYTGKLLFGIYDLIRKGFFAKGTTIMAIHTGGLQGIKGFNQRFGNIIT